MKRLTTRGIATAQAIANREEFNTSGALRARVGHGGYHWGSSGYLRGDDLDRWNLDYSGISYVVYSYDTPIAWWHFDKGWYKVKAKFSLTTSKHQGNLYLI